METIQLIGVEETFERVCTRIAQLFNDEAKVSFNNPSNIQEVPLTILFQEGNGEMAGVLSEYGKAVNQIEITYTIENNNNGRTKKQAVCYLLLRLLEEYTGIEQPWGILTGIRPTKLYHMFRREGRTQAEIRAQLKEKYLLTNEKIALLETIVEQQLKVIPDFDRIQQEVSIYIGIPFCPTMCAYCTFPAYAINGKNGSVTEFLHGLHYEMGEMGKWLKENNKTVTTIYFGGGTPTSISAEQMDRLYAKMYEAFPNVENVRELTVEAGRPDTISEEKVAVLKKWKIDRISVNPQSFKNETLQAIGRHHTVEETINKYNLAYESGLTNINMDLIIGLPGEGVEEFSNTLAVTKQLRPTSITVHTLSYKRASQMTKYKEKYKVANREEIHEMMNLASDWMTEEGYRPYYLYRQKNILGNLENVGYALPDSESIYNIVIMEEAQTIIGLGCGASSKWVDPVTRKIDRFANPKDPKTYIERYEEYTEKKLEALKQLFQ